MKTRAIVRAASRSASILFVIFAVLVSVWFPAGRAATISENFSTDPLGRGWRVFGDTNLFHWNAAGQNVGVTWDSSQSNSYFHLPLGTILNRQDDFSVAFDLQLTDIAGGVNPDKSSTFELGIGFLNIVEATQTNFLRAAHSPNLVEFDFFPGTELIAPTVWPSFWSTNSVLNYNGSSDYTILDLPVSVILHISMAYTASNRTMVTSIVTNGTSIGPVHSVKLSSSFTDFRVGSFAIESYSDAGQNPQYGGSLLAHGSIDNIVISVPPPPVQNLAINLASNMWEVSFASRTNWVYTLARTTDFQSWADVSSPVNGTGTNLTLLDTNATTARAFYHVRAERPE